MAKKEDKKLDSIFDATNGKKAVKPRPAPSAAPSAAKSEPIKKAPPPPAPPSGGDDLSINKFKVLTTLLKTHEQEALYRKSKEDRLFMLGLALVTAVAVGAFMVRATCGGGLGCGWFYSLVYRTFFSVMTGMIGFTIAAMIELNRTRLQDLLAMIVKIQESFKLFDDGAYAKDGGAYLPNTYKFIGSINDDETNYFVLVLKVGSIVAAVALFILV
jgi:hypothetical protein